jgi:hypothetical protein
MNRRDRSNVLGWQKCAAGEARCGGRGAIRRERWTNFFCAADASGPFHLVFRCFRHPRSVSCVAGMDSGRRIPYTAPDKKRL